MTITRITGQNIKGRSFSHALSPTTLIVGPNASGKSAILSTLRLCLLGYEPTLSRKKPDIFQLSSASTMGGAIEFENGLINTFDLKMNAKGVVSGSFDLSIELPPILLDTKEYFDVPKNERTAFLLKRVGAAAITVSSICNELFKVKDAVELMTELNIHLNTQLKAKGLQPFELVDCAQDFLRERRLNIQREIDALQGAVETAVRQESEGQKPVLQNMEPQMAEQQRVIAEKNKQLQQLREELGRINAFGQQVVDLRQKIENFKPIDAQPTRDQLTKLEAEHLSFGGVLDGSDVVLAEWERWNESLSISTRELTRLTQEIARLEKRHQEAKGQIVKIVCQHCQKENEIGNTSVATEIHQQLEAARASAKTTENERELAQKKLAELKPQVEGFQKKAKEIEVNRAATTAAHAELERIDRHNRQIDQLKHLLTEAEAKLAAERPRAFNLEDGQRATRDLEEAQKALAALQQQQNQWVAQKADERRAEQAAEERRKKSEEVKQLTSALEAVRDYQQRIIGEAITPLMAAASMLTRPVMGFDLEYRDGDIGYIRGKNWVGYRTFSGTEELLFLAGLAVAFAQESPLKLVVMDELGRLTSGTKWTLMSAIRDLIDQGVIHQFVGVDVSADAYTGLKDINLIQL